MIVNADDFGLSGEVNRAIVEAFERGLVTSTSLMANQDGFEEACGLARDRGLVVGVHLVLTRGRPLTGPIPRFCDAKGRFTEWRGRGSVFRLSRGDREAAARELRAQLERCRAEGLGLAHVDSHHHVHNEWAIGGVVLALAREFGIPRVRLARNCGVGIGRLNAAYKRLFNARVRRAGLAGTRWFGDAADWQDLRASGASSTALADFELMTHPAPGPDGSLVDAELGGAFKELLAPLLA